MTMSGETRSAQASTVLAYALSLLSSRQLQSLADQVIVSATSFVVLLVLGRWSAPSEVGTYVIATSIVTLGLAVSDSLITRPYTIRMRRPVGTTSQHAYSALLLVLVLAALFSVLLVSAAAVFGSAAGTDFFAAALALALLVPFALLREFARRIAFARMNTEQALIVDGAVGFFTVIGLGLLVATGRHTATDALLVMAATCAFVSVGWLIVNRGWFHRAGAHTTKVLRQSWDLGKWLLASQVAMQIQGYVGYWLSMVLLGSATTGIYAAAMSIVALTNPLLFGFFNLLTPKSVNALHEGGSAMLRRQAVRDAVLLAGIMSGFCLLLWLFGGHVFELLFPRGDYRAGEELLVLLGLASLAASIGVPASTALAAAERVKELAAVIIGTAVVAVALVAVSLSAWGLIGGAYALLVAEIIGSVGRWAAYLLLRDLPSQSSKSIRIDPATIETGALDADRHR